MRFLRRIFLPRPFPFSLSPFASWASGWCLFPEPVVHDAFRKHFAYLFVAHAQAAERLLRVLSQPRRGVTDFRELTGGFDRQTDGFHAADDRVVVLDHHIARLDVRVGEDLL